MDIPVTRNFDKTDLIGMLRLRDGVDIPLDSVFTLGIHNVTLQEGKLAGGQVQEVSLVSDSSYLQYLKHVKGIVTSDEEALVRIKRLEQTLADIKAVAIQAMTEPSPMPNALTWDCFVRIRNAVEQAQRSEP